MNETVVASPGVACLFDTDPVLKRCASPDPVLQFIRLIFTKETKMKCSDLRRFGFFFFLLWVQNSVAQDFMGWPNFNSVPDTIKNSETETPAARAKKAPRPQRQIDWQPWN